MAMNVKQRLEQLKKLSKEAELKKQAQEITDFMNTSDENDAGEESVVDQFIDEVFDRLHIPGIDD